MFKQDLDSRLSAWATLRSHLEQDSDPLSTVWQFWQAAPFIPYNNRIDPYNRHAWPTPWEIIAENKYDDFTLALMIAYTIKYTTRFANSQVELRTLVDKDKNIAYNIVFIDDEWAINYTENGPISAEKVPDSFSLENMVVIGTPR